VDFSRRALLTLGAGALVSSVAAIKLLAQEPRITAEIPDVALLDLPGRSLTSKITGPAANGRLVYVPPGLYESEDFIVPANDPVFSLYTGDKIDGLVGAGAAHTTMRVRPMTSTRIAMVPPSDGGLRSVNPLYVARFDGASPGEPPTEIGRFALLGTPQGHTYSGLLAFQGTCRLHDLLVKAIPGDSGVNPGETFSVNLYRQVNTKMIGVVVDGTDEAGGRVTASGVGINFCHGVTVEGGQVSNTGFGSGFACYESGDLTFTGVSTTDTAFYGLNFENCTGVQRITRHLFRRNARGKAGDERAIHLAIASNRSEARLASYVIEDPVHDGPKLRVRSSGYLGQPKTQDDSLIRLFVRGKERPDLLEIIPS
jgi:hypothetical protein